MEVTIGLLVFIFLAGIMVVFSVLAVTTKRVLRAATYLLFVLIGTAGIYFHLNYSFLGTIQLLVYAGGITVLYVFSILLTSSQAEQFERLRKSRFFAGFLTALAGAGICLFFVFKNEFHSSQFAHGEHNMQEIGLTMMGAGKYQYILPFEVMSLLLLACIIGGILIARKR
ncbi:MAG: NADH-quinone oxidoreductase subunit J [Tannerella sp.]|jgi:NADH-quinone oxidoreductase subunit J|nr:NADH-quinone oxidoreductase subunit J [Tannerella sp.]